jgi:hypothetical protein
METQSRNLWSVRMKHRETSSLWIMASNVSQAAKKAIAFSKKEDCEPRPVVKEVKFSGTIDKF